MVITKGELNLEPFLVPGSFMKVQPSPGSKEVPIAEILPSDSKHPDIKAAKADNAQVKGQAWNKHLLPISPKEKMGLFKAR